MFKKVLFVAGAALLISSPALAKPKPWYFSWWLGQQEGIDFENRYKNYDLSLGSDAHDRQWDSKKWNPDVWIQQEKGGTELITGFYEAGILEDQTIEDDIPYLHVGPNFYNLSGYDQRRIVQSVDEVYDITNIETDDLFFLYDPYTRKVIGAYTKHGLQLR